MLATEMLRLEYQRTTSQTKQAWFLNLLLIRATISIGHKSQGFIWKYASWNSFLSTNMKRSPAEICFFLVIWQRRHGVWARDKETQGKGKEQPQVRWMPEILESHSSMAAAIAKGDPHGGSETWDKGQWGSQGQDSAILPKPCFVLSLQDWDPPPLISEQHCCLTPNASCGCTQACLCNLVITTLRKPD